MLLKQLAGFRSDIIQEQSSKALSTFIVPINVFASLLLTLDSLGKYVSCQLVECNVDSIKAQCKVLAEKHTSINDDNIINELVSKALSSLPITSFSTLSDEVSSSQFDEYQSFKRMIFIKEDVLPQLIFEPMFIQ